MQVPDNYMDESTDFDFDFAAGLVDELLSPGVCALPVLCVFVTRTIAWHLAFRVRAFRDAFRVVRAASRDSLCATLQGTTLDMLQVFGGLDGELMEAEAETKPEVRYRSQLCALIHWAYGAALAFRDLQKV